MRKETWMGPEEPCWCCHFAFGQFDCGDGRGTQPAVATQVRGALSAKMWMRPAECSHLILAPYSFMIKRHPRTYPSAALR